MQRTASLAPLRFAAQVKRNSLARHLVNFEILK
jgi:hypothetical protein